MINPSVGGFLSAKVDPIKNRRYKSFTITGGIGTIPADGVHSPVSLTLKGSTATPYNISKWRRCNVLDNGTVSAYYGDINYKEDGSNGQVMVEIHT